MDIQEEVEEVKRELVEIIIKHLRENKLPAEKAKKLAIDFLNILPIKDQQDLLDKLKNLGADYQEANELYVDELTKVSEQKRNETLSQMRDHIKQGNIDRAIETANLLNKGS
ncbi:hypothetical protein M1146_02760 [Patescibacteria group bacterium]|nr:hypothetical protein [Patescibacteria group bacterium]